MSKMIRILLFCLLLSLIAGAFLCLSAAVFAQGTPAAPSAFEEERQELLREIRNDTRYLADVLGVMPFELSMFHQDFLIWIGYMPPPARVAYTWEGTGAAGAGGSAGGGDGVPSALVLVLIYVMSFLIGCLLARIFTGALRF